MAKTISLLASRMPVRLDFSAVFFSKCSVHFFLYYTCCVFRSRNSGKAFEFLSKRLVLLLYGSIFSTQNNVFVVDEESRGGELSLFACPGVGNRPPSVNKIANPGGGVPGGDGNR